MHYGFDKDFLSQIDWLKYCFCLEAIIKLRTVLLFIFLIFYLLQMNAILENLPKNRRTLLFSATQTKNVKDLVRLALKNPIYISAHENAPEATPSSLEQV